VTIQFMQMLGGPVITRNNELGLTCLNRGHQRILWTKAAIRERLPYDIRLQQWVTTSRADGRNIATAFREADRYSGTAGKPASVRQQNPRRYGCLVLSCLVLKIQMVISRESLRTA
jgi:hypothetical protein